MELPPDVLDGLYEQLVRPLLTKEPTMKARVSNTGRCVTLTFDQENIAFDRVVLDYNIRSIRLTPNESGNKISLSGTKTCSISKNSKHFPDWPPHGLVDLEFQEYVSEGECFFEAVLPTTLPSARPVNRGKPNASSEEAAKSTQSNVTINMLGGPHNFQVPETDLLPLVLEWAKKGYLL